MEQVLTFEKLPEAVKMLTKEVSEMKRLLMDKQEQTTTDQPEQLLSIDEAAEFLRLAKPTLYSKVSRNEIPFMKRGKRLYFSRTELMDYLKGGRKKSQEEIREEVDSFLANKKKANQKPKK
jgi:excisionase family DNA binding protein